MAEAIKFNSQFEKVTYCAKRAFDLESGAPSLLGPEAKGHKPTVVALMEVERGLIIVEKEENMFDNF